MSNKDVIAVFENGKLEMRVVYLFYDDTHRDMLWFSFIDLVTLIRKYRGIPIGISGRKTDIMPILITEANNNESLIGFLEEIDNDMKQYGHELRENEA